MHHEIFRTFVCPGDIEERRTITNNKMNEKREKSAMKVQGSVTNKYPDTEMCIEENLKVCQNEKISVEEVFFFVDLLF